jgi:hypothetical protein
MYLHSEVLALSPSDSRVVIVVRDKPANRLSASRAHDFDDIVDEWGLQSFPASDPPSNW